MTSLPFLCPHSVGVPTSHMRVQPISLFGLLLLVLSALPGLDHLNDHRQP